MTARRHAFAYVVLALALTQFSCLSAMAQGEIKKKAAARIDAAVSKIANACKSDVSKFCGDVTHGEGRMAFCMIAHGDKVSNQCFDTILDVGDEIRLSASNVVRTAQACSPDISKHCGTVKAGDGRIASCLFKNQTALSRSCKAEIAGLKVRVGR